MRILLFSIFVFTTLAAVQGIMNDKLNDKLNKKLLIFHVIILKSDAIENDVDFADLYAKNDLRNSNKIYNMTAINDNLI